jgi:peptidoglycan-N-acetylglucosamine deacetylase
MRAGFGEVAVHALAPPPVLVSLAALRRRDILFRVRVNRRVAALTLDDGPDPVLTPRVLDALDRHRAKATFFLIGERAVAEPELVQLIRTKGHEIGNHLWREERAAGLSDEAFERSLVRTHVALDSPRLFRPGSGLVSRRKVAIAGRHGYRCALGSVYPYDAHLRPRPRVIAARARRIVPGDIIILHEGQPSRASVVPALDALLTTLDERGYRAVTVSALRHDRIDRERPGLGH